MSITPEEKIEYVNIIFWSHYVKPVLDENERLKCEIDSYKRKLKICGDFMAIGHRYCTREKCTKFISNVAIFKNVSSGGTTLKQCSSEGGTSLKRCSSCEKELVFPLCDNEECKNIIIDRGRNRTCYACGKSIVLDEFFSLV
jgi:hypothetical protein